MVLKIACLGSPLLRKKAKPVSLREIKKNSFHRFLRNMKDAMRRAGGVGIAAPQVRVSKRIFCVECVRSKRYPNTPQIRFYTAINPRVRYLKSQKTDFKEGCLSVPGLRGTVRRYNALRLTAWDEKGRPFQKVARGFHARIIQHEMDHLNGKVFLDRMKNLKHLFYEKK